MNKLDVKDLLKLIVVPIIDAAVVGRPILKMAWSFIKPLLLSAKTADDVHAQMMVRGMAKP